MRVVLIPTFWHAEPEINRVAQKTWNMMVVVLSEQIAEVCFNFFPDNLASSAFQEILLAFSFVNLPAKIKTLRQQFSLFLE